MNKIQKSNKILGLEKMKELGFNVPKFDFIPDYTDLNISNEDINVYYPPIKLKNIIKNKINNLDLENGISIRSASFDEDGSNESSAGRYLSFNGLKYIDEIVQGAIYIWQHHRQNSKNVKCPLIIQETHPSIYSGVAFKDGDISIIESYFGACQNIVNGAVKPYITQISKNNINNIYSQNSRFCYLLSIHKKFFKNCIYLPGQLLTKPIDSFIDNPRFYEFQNKEIINIYGYRKSLPINTYEEKILPQIISILEKLDNVDGVDIEWGSDINGNVYMYQFRKLTRKISSLNISFDKKNQNDVIFGIPSSAGIAEGVVTDDITNLNEDSILILTYENIEDINLIKNIKGIISLSGGILSHLSIICRELNIPCIVSINKPIASNTKVRIDGNTGLIKILD